MLTQPEEPTSLETDIAAAKLNSKTHLRSVTGTLDSIILHDDLESQWSLASTSSLIRNLLARRRSIAFHAPCQARVQLRVCQYTTQQTPCMR